MAWVAGNVEKSGRFDCGKPLKALSKSRVLRMGGAGGCPPLATAGRQCRKAKANELNRHVATTPRRHGKAENRVLVHGFFSARAWNSMSGSRAQGIAGQRPAVPGVQKTLPRRNHLTRRRCDTSAFVFVSSCVRSEKSVAKVLRHWRPSRKRRLQPAGAIILQ